MLSTLPAVSTPPVTLQPPAPTAPESAPETHEDSRAFARQLQAAQQHDERGAAPQKAGTAAPKSARHATPAGAGKARTEPSEVADTADAASLAGAPAEAAAAAAQASTTAGNSLTGATTSDARDPGPQDLSALLAHLRGHGLPATPATEPGRRGAGLADDGSEAGPHAGQAGKAGRATATAGSLDTDATRTDALAAAATKARDSIHAAAGAQFKEQLARAQMQSPAQDLPAAPAPGPVPPETSAFNAALAATAGTAAQAQLTQGSSATTPVQVSLPAAFGSPEFAPQLGAQISTFVRDGVQHAQLHLNPAEMGPVTVQIQLDGQTAQVHLLADQAATRQALEQAMPQLAGSLREAGLTLSGGGVFQQPRQAGGEPGSPQGRSDNGRSRSGSAAVGALGGDDSPSATHTGGLAAPRRRGVVDLVA